jgi:hypothetical protein
MGENLSQVTDKLYHIMCCIEYISSERGSNSTLVVMGTDCICSYKSIFTFFQILKTAIGNCLRSCSRMNVESVAFPAVGSGQLLGYPIDHVIDCLINESKVDQLYSKLHNWVHRRTGCCTHKIKGGHSNHAMQSHNIILYTLPCKIMCPPVDPVM